MVRLGGGAYTCSAIGYLPRAVSQADRDHEAAVSAFFAKARKRSPVKSAAVAARWPVLTESQMRHRGQREIACGDAGDLMVVGSRTRAHYAQTVFQPDWTANRHFFYQDRPPADGKSLAVTRPT